MQRFDFRQSPIKVFGVPFWDERREFIRLPKSVEEQLPEQFVTWNLSRRCPGARVAFRTDSPTFRVHIDFETMSPDPGMSIYSCQSANVFIGERTHARYAGLVQPKDYDARSAEAKFDKSTSMEDVTIFLPRNEIIRDVVIEIEDGTHLEAPTPYRYPLPLLLYGNSVTEGACCSKAANSYAALLSRWMDLDYINFGFSGSACGELALADYINTIPMGLMIMDYDHNAPSAEFLQQTHEPFFRRIRQKHPDLPIVLMTASNVDWCPECTQRQAIIRATYENALASGDQNVYLVNGADLWDIGNRADCTADRVHPNDLGMYHTAEVLRPVIEGILRKQYGA